MSRASRQRQVQREGAWQKDPSTPKAHFFQTKMKDGKPGPALPTREYIVDRHGCIRKKPAQAKDAKG